MRHPKLPPRLELPGRGRWLWTCRAGFEGHLYEELAWQKAQPKLLGPALVESEAPKSAPAFARQGFVVDASGPLEALHAPRGPGHLQAWVPDTDDGNRLSGGAQSILAAWRETRGADELPTPKAAWDRGTPLFQLAVLSAQLGAVGRVMARDALSLAPGGRHRMLRDRDAPSRAALKLEEALESFGHSPGPEEACVDLGAAPGGWTQRLISKGARVVAVDPAALMPELLGHRLVKHVRSSAFGYQPPERTDWLFCDMAWRPLEVAALLGKWARNRWTRFLVANIKLPMNDKNTIIFRVRALLEAGGWQQLRVRQLYHDRDEVTVTARLER